MTSAAPPPSPSPPSSSSGSACLRDRPVPRAGAAAVPRRARERATAPSSAAVVRFVVVFFEVAMSVYGRGLGRSAALVVGPRALEEGTEVVEGDPSVDVLHRALDHVLELGGVQYA